VTPQPIIDYTGYEHCLGGTIYIHRPTGNIYFIECEKRNSTGQDLSIYRIKPGVFPIVPELVHRYVGGVDAVAQFAQTAGIMIDNYGALIATFASQPKNTPKITTTGFVNQWDWFPGVDAPWVDDVAHAQKQIAELQQQVAELQTALGNQQAATLTLEDEAALDWVKRETKALG